MSQCDPINDPTCVLRELTADERQVLAGEAARLKTSTILECRQLGQELENRLGSEGQIEGWDRFILAENDEGGTGILTGDYHHNTSDGHTSHVHLFGLQMTGSLVYKGTARHEMAHVLGYNEVGATALSTEDGMGGLCS
jgi:hypothetical protein